MSILRSRVIRWAAIASAAFLTATAVSPSPAATWQSIGPDGGRVDGFAQAPTDPDRMYALPNRQGLLRSTDRGVSWTTVGTPLDENTWSQVAVSPIDEDLILIGDPVADTILRSTDGGTTITTVPLGVPFRELVALEFDPADPNVILAAPENYADTGLFRSTDAGLSWSAVNTGLNELHPRDLAFHPTTPGLVLAGMKDGLYRSTDSGQSWAQLTTGFTLSLSYCAAAPHRLWILANDIRYSDDDGTTTTSVAPIPGCTSECWPSRLAAHPTDPQYVVAGAEDNYCTSDCNYQVRLAVTTNAGATWANTWSSGAFQNEDERMSQLVFDHTDPTVCYASIGSPYGLNRVGLLRSTDTGLSWTNWEAGIRGQGIIAVDVDDAGGVYARRIGNVGLWSAPSDLSAWTERTASPGSNIAHTFETVGSAGIVHEISGSASFDTFSSNYGRSTDGGVSWTVGSLPEIGLFTIATTIAASAGAGDTVYVWLDGFSNSPYRLVRSTNGGLFFGPDVESVDAIAAVVDPTNADHVFAADLPDGRVHFSSDAGATWAERSSGLPLGEPIALFLDPANVTRLAIVYENDGVFRSDDSGLTWSEVPLALGGARVVSADWAPSLDRFALATAADGVYLSESGFVNDGLPTRYLLDVCIDAPNERVLLGTGYASAWAIDLPNPTAVVLDEEARTNVVLRAWPNPTSAGTTLRFNVRTGGAYAELSLFGVDGRRVRTLVSSALSAGEHSIAWDGLGRDGERLSAGVYYARLRLGREVGTQKIVVAPGR